jgi:hypothetical protein
VIEMHYDEGHLLTWIDGELPAGESARTATHVTACETCAAEAVRLRAERALAAKALAGLQPAAEVLPLHAAGTGGSPATAGEPTGAGVRARVRRTAWTRYAAIAAAAAILLGSFAFAPVRNAAAGLLRVFRVQNVQTLTLTEADLQKLGSALESGSGRVDLESFGEAWIDGARAEPKQVTLAQAQAAVDFPVLLPKDAVGTPVITLSPAQSYKFKLKVDAINQALVAYGSDRTLPNSLDGKVFSIMIPPIVVAQYGTPAGEYRKEVLAGAKPGEAPFDLGQARSPELVVPEGVDAAQLRDVLVNLPFLPESVREQLAAVTDWQSTLIIPNVDGTARDITIGGTPAVVVSPQGAARDLREKMGPLPDSAMVIWNQGGVVRALGGAISEEKAIALAKSTMR